MMQVGDQLGPQMLGIQVQEADSVKSSWEQLGFMESGRKIPEQVLAFRHEHCKRQNELDHYQNK